MAVAGLLQVNRREALLLDRDRDHLRQHRRVVRNVQVVAQHQLQRVLAGRQGELGFGLSTAEVPHVVGHRQCRVEIGRFREIDEQVMVPAVGITAPRRGRRPCLSSRTGP